MFDIILTEYIYFSSIVKKIIMNTKLNKILAEISAGELIDKITILEIKKEKISNKDKLNANVEKELKSLNDTFKNLYSERSSIAKISRIKLKILI